MSLKIVKFDTKMYSNLSNFRGRTSAGGGQALVQKRGQVSDGGIGKIFAGWGTPQSPQEKNPAFWFTSESTKSPNNAENSVPCDDLKGSQKPYHLVNFLAEKSASKGPDFYLCLQAVSKS